MKRKIPAALAAIGLLLGLTACAEKVALSGLEVSGSLPVLAVGGSAPVELAYSFSKEAPTEEEITEAMAQVTLVWASSDEAVATVDANGTVTALAPGSAEITVSADFAGDTSGSAASGAESIGAYTATVPVTVVQPLTDATVQQTLELDLLAGETKTLEVAIQPADASNITVSYASSDEAVATVDANGKITPVAEGETTITTTVTGEDVDGPVEKTLTTTVTVLLLPQGIALEQTEGLLYVGYSTQLAPYTMPEEAPASTYTYASSDEAVATVDETGSIKAVGPGTATLTVTSAEGHKAEYALTVTAAPRGGGGSGGSSGGNGGSGSGGAGGSSSGNGGGASPAGGDGGGGGGVPPPADQPPAGGGGGGTPDIGDGTPDNPYENEYIGVGEDDLHGGDGLGGGAW